MVMNNIIIIFFWWCVITIKATAASQQQCHLQMRTKTAYRNFRMSYRCFGRPVLSLHTPERNQCKVQFVDVSKTWKSYARHKQVRFIGYLHMWVTSVVSSASETSTTSRRRSASDYRLASSMPRSRPPTRKRPTVVYTDRDARVVPTARDPWHL